MAKKKDTIEIPLSLARLLVAEKEDMVEPTTYEAVAEVAKAALKVLLAAN